MKTAPAIEPPRATRAPPPAGTAARKPSGPLLAAVLTVIQRAKRTDHATRKRS